MQLYTIQPPEILSALEHEKVLEADPTKGEHWECPLPDGRIILGFQEQYEWLKLQMHQRVADYNGENLWWAWTDKPDLRSHAACYPKGETYVCLTLDVPDSKVLVSDFDRWGEILNGAYIDYTQEQNDRWEAHYTMTPWEEWENLSVQERDQQYYDMLVDEDPQSAQWQAHLKEIIQQSWESIFDTNGYNDPAAKDWVGTTPQFQATFGQLRLDELKQVRTFKGRRT